MEKHSITAFPSNAFWNKKRVLITGHTGFKGVWLSLWLQSLGASVAGYSTTPTAKRHRDSVVSMDSFSGDICDRQALHNAIQRSEPEIVFHLAAQPLVRSAFDDPIATYRANIVGTATLLECVRHCPSVRAVAIVTTDKCYEMKDWDWAYRESDRLGGTDPYSTSKACMELVVSAFRDSFFPVDRYPEHRIALASARTGNVVGGGDWARDRLIPDTIHSFAEGRPVTLRNPGAMRPWQYVLDALRGYLLLAERLYEHGTIYSGAWNFGPETSGVQSVQWIVARLAEAWGADAKWDLLPGEHSREAQMLTLDCSKAAEMLQWKPTLPLTEALHATVDWYRACYARKSQRDKYLEQIAAYSARTENIPVLQERS